MPAGTGGTPVFAYTHDEPAEDVIVACTGATVMRRARRAERGRHATRRRRPTDHPDAAVSSRTTTLLFDGTSTAGWMQSGPGEFRVEDGSLVTYGGLGPALVRGPAVSTTSRSSCRGSSTGETNNSGVFARFPDPGNDPFVAVNQGYEIQIYDGSDGRAAEDGVDLQLQAGGDAQLQPDRRVERLRGPRRRPAVHGHAQRAGGQHLHGRPEPRRLHRPPEP